jgi:hypothetical protein
MTHEDPCHERIFARLEMSRASIRLLGSAQNLFIARGEGRFGIGVLRPSAFAVCDLTA